jgi:hypothetical protein
MNFPDPVFGHKHHRHSPLHILRFVVAAAFFVLLFGFVVMLLWNALLPSLFGLHTVTYWQSVGMLLLARLLVGGRPGPPRPGFARLGARPAWNEYEEWWRQAGKQSFQDFTNSRPDKP